MFRWSIRVDSAVLKRRMMMAEMPYSSEVVEAMERMNRGRYERKAESIC